MLLHEQLGTASSILCDFIAWLNSLIDTLGGKEKHLEAPWNTIWLNQWISELRNQIQRKWTKSARYVSPRMHDVMLPKRARSTLSTRRFSNAWQCYTKEEVVTLVWKLIDTRIRKQRSRQKSFMVPAMKGPTDARAKSKIDWEAFANINPCKGKTAGLDFMQCVHFKIDQVYNLIGP